MTISRRSLITSSTTGLIASALTVPTIATANQSASPAGATPTAGDPNLDARLLATIEEHGIPGALVLVDSPESGQWTAALGVANIDTGAPMTTDMHMRVGSITKTFTATMVLQLVDQDVLSLDDTLAAIDPELADLPNADSITIRHLLTMQSGLPDYVATDRGLELSRQSDLEHVYTTEELLGFIDGMPAEFPPGEQGMYSNTNYLILGMVAEGLTGTPWRDLVRTGILDEVDLANTTLPEDPDLPDPFAHGYAYTPQSPAATPGVATPASPAGPVDVTRLNPSISGAAGSMISTLEDIHTWMSVLREGTLLSPELHADRFDFANAAELPGAITDMKYGLGIAKVDGMVGHDGGIAGFRATMFHLLDEETTIVTLANILPTRDGSDPAGVLMNAIRGA